MRQGLPLLLLLLFLAAAVQPGVAQETLELPTYAPGDFWTYDVLFPGLDALLEELDENVTLTVEAELTSTIEGTEARDVGGTSVDVYNASQHAEFAVSGDVDLNLSGFPLSLEFTANITLDGSVYMTTAGLELVAANLAVEAVVVAEGETFAEANGTLVAEIEYTQDTWEFPLEVGSSGEEAFDAVGDAFATVTALDETMSLPASFNGSATFVHEVERAESVEVPAGTFDTLVINTTIEEETEVLGHMLTYWSAQAGGPVKRDVISEGEIVASLELTDYRYRAAERLSILGLDAVYWIPIGVGAVVVVVVILRLAMRGRA